MKTPFRSKYRITQEYGVNADYYKQFGLKAHEGIDLVPNGTSWDILSLEDGVVVLDDDIVGSVSSDPYGKIVTIWHPTIHRATMYCHLTENAVVNGQQVKRGEKIGVMGSTGNSAGAHLHLNLFEVDDNGVRLNRNNGYLGGIDPKPYLEEDYPIEQPAGVYVDEKKFRDLEYCKESYNLARKRLDVEDSRDVFLARIDELQTYKQKVIDQERIINDSKDKAAELERNIVTLQEKISVLIKEKEIIDETLKEYKRQSDIMVEQVADLQRLIGFTPPKSGLKRLLFDWIVATTKGGDTYV